MTDLVDIQSLIIGLVARHYDARYDRPAYYCGNDDNENVIDSMIG